MTGIRLCTDSILSCIAHACLHLQRSELRGFTVWKHCELSSAAGFHDPDAEPVADDDLIFALGVLQGPVEIVELDLDEIELPFMPCQERLEQLRPSVNSSRPH